MAGFTEGIKVFFGGDTAGLKAALGDAKGALDKFNEHSNRIQHKLLEGLFGFEAIRRVKEWAGEAIKGAQETREEFEKLGRPIEDSTRSLAEFGDALKDVKEGTVGAVGTVLSWFTRAGEGWGMLINRIRGISAEEEKLNEETARNAAKQEKQRDEAIKAHAKDGEKAVEIEKKIAEARAKNALAQLDLDGQINELTKRFIQLKKDEAAIIGDTDTARLQRGQKRLEQVTLQGEIESKYAERKKKQQEEDKKWEEEIIRLNEKIADQKMDALKPEERIGALKSENLELEKQLAKEVANSTEAKKIQVQIGENNRKIEQDQLAIAEKRKKEEEEIAKQKKIQLELTALNNKMQSDFLANVYGLKGGGDVTEASTETLQEVIRKNKNKLSSGTLDEGGTFRYGDSMTIVRLKNEIAKAQAELDLRNKTRFDLSLGGEAGARRNYQGNPFAFDRFFSQWVKGQSSSDSAAQYLKDIRDALTKTGIITKNI